MCSGNKSKHVFNSRILLLLETRAQKQRKIRVGDKKTCYYWQNSVYTNCVHCSASQCQASLLTQYSKQASAVTLCCFLFLQKIWLLEEETNALRRKIRAWNFVVPTLSFVQEALSPSSPPVLALDFLTHNVNQLVKNLIMSLNVLRIKKKVLVS